jgi:ATP-dependent DNA helicase RecQ
VRFREERRPQVADSSSRQEEDPIPESGPKRELFEALRERRLELARDQDVPPYVIFNDSTLHAIVEHLPETPREFRRLHGVGDVKLERYGDTFLEVVRLWKEQREAVR